MDKQIYSKEVIDFVKLAADYCLKLEHCNEATPRELVKAMLGTIPYIYIKANDLIDRVEDNGFGTDAQVTEDDYNFIAQTYNSLRQITHTIRMTVPDSEERERLIESYSKRMLEDGEVIDVNAVLSQYNQKNDNKK